MPETVSNAPAGSARIDRWLFAVRLFGSRALAAQAVSGGRVHVNGVRVKPAHPVRPGNKVNYVRGAVEFECAILAVPARRGPAREAARCYQESPDSSARRAAHAERMRLAPTPGAGVRKRPDKRERSLLLRLRGRI
jgi:ribosome-associated heat shock protein Hsp15